MLSVLELPSLHSNGNPNQDSCCSGKWKILTFWAPAYSRVNVLNSMMWSKLLSAVGGETLSPIEALMKFSRTAENEAGQLPEHLWTRSESRKRF